jgi:glycosyltransferase involved in cell wall biosynthesis
MSCTVLYLAGSSGRGGVETFLKTLARHHKRPEFVPVFFLFHDGPLAKGLREAGAEVVVARSAFRLRNPLSFFALVREIASLARKTKAAIVHSSMAYAALPGAAAAILAGARHVWFQHGPVGGWMDWLAGNLPYDLLLSNSTYTLNCQERWLSWQSRSKSRVVPLGTEIPEAEVRAPHSPPRALMLCRAQHWKGGDLFAEAVKQLRNSGVGLEGTIYLAEGDAETRERIEAAGSLKIEPPLDDPNPAFAKAEILVNASRTSEPFGLTLIEGMARGLVPVAPRAGGPLEILEEGKTGLFFESGSAGELAARLRLLAEQPDLLRKLSVNARQAAQERFSAAIMVSRIEDAYREIFSSRRAASTGQEKFLS